MKLEKFNEFMEKANKIAKGQGTRKIERILKLTQEYNINASKNQVTQFIIDVQ